MSTNHEMNYYDYGKTLDIQGVMPVIGGGVSPEPEPELETINVGYAGSTSGSWLFISVNQISYDPEMPPQVSGIYYWDDMAGQSFYISGGFEYQPEQEGWFSQLALTIDFNQEYKLQISIEGINYYYKVSWYEYIMPEPEPDTHEYVDLGLPSGTLWATENIKDADGKELYFAWGETQGYTSGQIGTDKYFSWFGDHADYKYGPFNTSDQENSGMTKYNKTDGKKVLDEEDDAATANWGSNWKMPTKEQFDELISSANTTSAFTEQNGVSGLLVTSKVEGHEGNSVFFPAFGFATNGNVYNFGTFGLYWSVSLNDSSVGSACKCYFYNMYCGLDSDARNYGYSVRPVHK